MPLDVNELRQKILANVARIQKVIPDFKLTDEQINNMISPERLRAHEKAQTFVSNHSRLDEVKNEVKKYCPSANLSKAFQRNYFHVVKLEDTPEAHEFNRRMFTNIQREDQLGETARENYTVFCLNACNKLDTTKLMKNPYSEEFLDYALQASETGGIAMETSHFLTDQPELKIKEQDQLTIARQLGEVGGGLLRDMPGYMKKETYLTFPAEYMTVEQLKLLTVNYKDFIDVVNDITGMISINELRTGMKEVCENYDKNFTHGDFTADDINYVTPVNKRQLNGIVGRRELLTQAYTALKDVQFENVIPEFDNSVKALVNLNEKLSVFGAGASEAEKAELMKASKEAVIAMHSFSSKPAIKKSADPAVRNALAIILDAMSAISALNDVNELNDIMYFYNEDQKQAQKGDGYKQIEDSLKGLNDFMNQYSVKDARGENQYLTADDIADIRMKMAEVIDKCDKYVLDENNKDKLLNDNVRVIGNRISKQLKAMSRTLPGATINEALSNNERTVDMTGHTFEKKGNQLSARLPMTITGPDGKKVQGFFTQRTTLDPVKNRKLIEDKLNGKFEVEPEIMKDVLDTYFNKNLNRREEEAYEAQFLQENPELSEFLKTAKELYEGYGSQRGIYEGMLNDKSSSDIDSRNVAMSETAELLGLSDILAKSVPLELMDDGVPMKGSFMVNAKGHDADVRNMRKDNPFMNIKPGYLDYSPALKQISEIQVLDYICGNIDRHHGNMFYSFDESGKINGIMGIDNDMSFGTDVYAGNHCTQPQNMKYVPDSLARKLSTLTPQMLKNAVCGNGLDYRALESACTRLQNVKNAINDGTIQIMPDEEFQTHKLEDFMAQGQNTFKIIENHIRVSIIGMDPGIRKNIMEKPDREAKPEQILDLFEKVDAKSIKQDNEPIANLIENLEGAQKNVHFGSKAFDKVIETAKILQQANESLSRDDRFVSQENMNKLEAAYHVLEKYCKAYLARKENQGKLNVDPNSKTGKRIAAVNEILSFCQNKEQVLQEQLGGKQLENETRDLRAEANLMMFESFKKDPKLAGGYIRALNETAAKEAEPGKIHAKVALELKTCIYFLKKNNISPEACGIEKADFETAKQNIQLGREANAREKNPEVKPVEKEEGIRL